jgi:hypothetical protein
MHSLVFTICDILISMSVGSLSWIAYKTCFQHRRKKILLDKILKGEFQRKLYVVADQSIWGTLYTIRAGFISWTSVLEVICPSTGNTYRLRVPSYRFSTAREAVAWTFGMSNAEYNPQVQT